MGEKSSEATWMASFRQPWPSSSHHFPAKIPQYQGSRFLSKGSSSGLSFFFGRFWPLFASWKKKMALRDDDHALNREVRRDSSHLSVGLPRKKVKVVTYGVENQRGHASFWKKQKHQSHCHLEPDYARGVYHSSPVNVIIELSRHEKIWHATNACLLDGGYHDSSICSPHDFIKHLIVHAAFVLCTSYVLHNVGNHTHVITSRAWGTLDLGILLALILGLIARIPQSDIVLIAAVRCIGIRSSSTRAARLLLLRVLILVLVLVLVVIKRLLILLLGLREGWAVVVLVLVI